MTAIRQMLETKGPMPLNEFQAAACAMVPAEATRYGKQSRLTIVKKWLLLYAKHFTIADGIIQARGTAKKAGGAIMLDTLKANGTITFEQSGLTRRHTYTNYIRALRKLGWVTQGSDGQVVWCGPADASFSIAWQKIDGKNRR